MDWEIEQRCIRLEDMIIVYQEHIDTLEEENDQLKKKIAILEPVSYTHLTLPTIYSV